MYRTIFPMELWEDYGIVSYNMGKVSSTLWISYYNLLLACQETTPKLVVVDCYLISRDEKAVSENYVNSTHEAFDCYPLSYQKYLAIKDLSDGKNLLENEIEYLFNFSLYHSRWTELEKEDFTDVETEYTKGAGTYFEVKDVETNLIDFDSVQPYSDEETINMIYLRKMIEYCQENDIEILVTYILYEADEENIASSKYVKEICEEYNVNYINFLNMDIINKKIDYSDEHTHVNQSGARKITNYLGQYIMENYNIDNQKENENYSSWKDDYDEYVDLKISNLESNKTNLNNYLMLLYGEEDISYEIKISSSKEISEGSTLQILLENLNNNYEIDDEPFVKNNNKTVKITTYDNRTGKEIATVWF